MEITSDDDLEVAAVLAKGLGQELTATSQQIKPGSRTELIDTTRRSSTVLTNNSRGNTATTTPNISSQGEAICNSIHQMAAKGELLLLRQEMEVSQVDDQDEFSLTPLLWASMFGQSDVAHFLLKSGAQPDITDPRGLTPLMTACYHGNVDVVRVLLEFGMDIDRVGEDGNTAVFYAVHGNHAECTRLLLEHGADITTRNHQGFSVLDLSIRRHHRQVQKTIEEYLMKALEGE